MRKLMQYKHMDYRGLTQDISPMRRENKEFLNAGEKNWSF